MAQTALPRRSAFPDGFVFGTATSAYQIEGHGFGGAGQTHWDSFAATPGNVVNAENGALACDHYHRWAADLDLIAGAGFDAYRFSNSWARILPDGWGTPNPEGLAFYDRLIDGMLERGIKPAATLYHWELPQPLADIGGWRNRETAQRFAEFAELIGRNYGDRLWSTAPINEPMCVAWLSHFDGMLAPGLRDIRATARAVHHVLLGHGLAIAALRAHGVENLGAVVNLEWAHPATDSAEDALAAARYDAIYNRMFLGPLFTGAYPDLVLEGLGPHLPDGWEADFGTIRTPLDWLGLNYYTCKRLAFVPGPWPNYAERPGPLPLTEMEWEIYPDGLRDFLVRTAQEYTGNLPLYVTENGMAAGPGTGDPSGTKDPSRIAYLASHLDAVQAAINAGVPLKGYFVWSLLDNYEWALGYAKRFGLVHVDFDTLDRTPKASYHALRQALRQDGT
ncbi:MAG: GH1 family beta-glucosidase [Pseudomonadota bacterium]